jgi:hypothetical protein
MVNTLRVLRTTAYTLDVVGVLIVSFSLLSVHNRQLLEHRMDEAVFDSFRWEGKLTIFAIVLFIIAFVLVIIAEILL